MPGAENHSFIQQICIEYLLRAAPWEYRSEPVRHDSARVEMVGHLTTWPKRNQWEPSPLPASKQASKLHTTPFGLTK